MKTALRTGGSSGIGLEISKYFLRDGFRVIWASLLDEEMNNAKKDLLEELPNALIVLKAIDLSNTSAAQKLYHWVKEQQFTIDVLVNNAGFGTYGYAKDISIDQEINMIQLNVLNVYQTTRLFLVDMFNTDAGTIINISSNTAFQPVPKMSAYAATKSFVKHYSLSLHEELKDLNSKVKIITICPAAIKNTAFKSVAKMDKVKTFEGLVATTKEEVAKDVWNAYQKNKSFVPSGAALRRVLFLQKILPRSIVQFMLRQELKEQ